MGKDDTTPAGKKPGREEKLAAALRANLRRRKAPPSRPSASDKQS